MHPAAGRREGMRLKRFSSGPSARVIRRRDDVDARKEHSLRFARIQHERGISGTYYCRLVPESCDTGVIREIAEMGHEIGYHYETMDTAGGKGGVVAAVSFSQYPGDHPGV